MIHIYWYIKRFYTVFVAVWKLPNTFISWLDMVFIYIIGLVPNNKHLYMVLYYARCMGYDRCCYTWFIALLFYGSVKYGHGFPDGESREMPRGIWETLPTIGPGAPHPGWLGHLAKLLKHGANGAWAQNSSIHSIEYVHDSAFLIIMIDAWLWLIFLIVNCFLTILLTVDDLSSITKNGDW